LAQWSLSDRTLYAKLVYYGPALGGKTTNLKTLHRLTDPESASKLLSLNTTDDRTLFFDLLPFELGSILGYKVAMKLYTVPGQVRYDATRRVVLAGADAVVFVADSDRSREKETRGALENLRINMRANRLNPATVPVLFQFNKQDLPGAASPKEVSSWLGIEPLRGFPAVASEGRGVLETFVAACKAMLERLVAFADARTRKALKPEELSGQIDRAFAPHFARQVALSSPAPSEPAPMVFLGENLLELSVQSSLELGDQLASERTRTSRLEREADALRRLSDALRAVEANFDRDSIVDAALAAAGQILRASAVSLIHQPTPGSAVIDRVWGRADDPLLGFEAGRALALKLIAADSPCVLEDLASELPSGEAIPTLAGLRAAASVPVEKAGLRTLVVYAPAPDGEFREADVRFLDTLAGHLAVGLDKARIYADLARQNDRLEETVRDRTQSLRKAYEDLRALDQMKDRFLSSLSHEMRTPLTAILSSATFLKDYEGSPEDRAEMMDAIITSGRALERLIDNVFRLIRLESRGEALQFTESAATEVAAQAIQLAGSPPVNVVVQDALGVLRMDVPRAARAVANLLDNAFKFSPAGSPVELRIAATRLKRADRLLEGVSFAVLDRGLGVKPEDLERVFAPFEQGGDVLTGKPPGIGLGLHEARTIARLHGGTVRFLARPDGGGEFRMVLPLAPIEVPGVVEAALA